MTYDQAKPSSSFNTSTDPTSDNILLFCINDSVSLHLTLVYASLNVLLFPLHVLVLVVGFQQWQQQQQGALSSIATSDVLTINLALFEIVGFLSAVMFTSGSYVQLTAVLTASFCLFAMYFFGEALFHCLICVDKYLAVVHPIKYRNLKESRAVLSRNVVIVVCWIGTLAWIPHVLDIYPEYPANALLGSVVTFTVIVLYCCLAALYVLTRPGPNGKKQVDKSKLKAFHIISFITCLLFLKMSGTVVYLCFYILVPLNPHQTCVTLLSSVIAIIPVNALIPLLYLRRRKSTCCV